MAKKKKAERKSTVPLSIKKTKGSLPAKKAVAKKKPAYSPSKAKAKGLPTSQGTRGGGPRKA